MNTMTHPPLSPISALLAHLESFVTDQRILIVGDAERSLAAQALERGARLVQVLDPDPKRVAQAASLNTERRITYAQLTKSSLRDGSFDLAVVEDAGIVGNLKELMQGVKRSINQQGAALICASNPDASTGLLGAGLGSVDYDELVDEAEETFDAVLMFGQSPFTGYSVGQLDLEHLPEAALDNEYLSEAETPDFYAAFCGTSEALSAHRIEELSIVQLPADRLLSDTEKTHQDRDRRSRRQIEALEKELRQAQGNNQQQEIDRLTFELEQKDAHIKSLEARAEAANARADDALAEVEELEGELEETHKALLRATKNTGSAERLKLELEALRKATEEAKHQSAGREALEEEVTQLDQKCTALAEELKKLNQTLEKREKRIAEQEKEIDDLHDELDEMEEEREALRKAQANATTAEEVRVLEAQLTAQGARVRELEGQLSQLETYTKTLSAELALTHRPAQADGESEQLRVLSQALAEREADLVSAKWTIGQLEKASLKG